MRVLFVHQGFPGQYRHILRAMAAQGGHTLVGMGISPLTEELPPGVTYVRYAPSRGNTEGIHPWVLETESKTIRGEACARVAVQLREQGFMPDLICAHPGWGEALYLKDVWPQAPLLTYQEFFYNASGVDFDFDPELQGTPDWEARSRMRMKNANVLLMLEASDWCVTPTAFQRSTFPHHWQERISTIHDGIDTELACPDAAVPPLTLPDGHVLHRGAPIVTFVNRHIEPYRGCHTMLRALPELLRRHPQAHVVIVGEQQGVSYGKAAPGGSWKEVFLAEVEGSYDLQRVHFTGSLPYSQFLQLLKITACHVYLTYPFVLSWSLLEAMASSAPVVGSSTAPVQEVIEDGKNGLLVDFFSPGEVVDAVLDILGNADMAARLGDCARTGVLEKYSLQMCIPSQLSLVGLVSARALCG